MGLKNKLLAVLSVGFFSYFSIINATAGVNTSLPDTQNTSTNYDRKLFSENSRVLSPDSAYSFVIVVQKKEHLEKLPSNCVLADSSKNIFYKDNKFYLSTSKGVYNLEIYGMRGILKENLKKSSQVYTRSVPIGTTDSNDTIYSNRIGEWQNSDTIFYMGNPFDCDFTCHIITSNKSYYVPVAEYFSTRSAKNPSKLEFEVGTERPKIK